MTTLLRYNPAMVQALVLNSRTYRYDPTRTTTLRNAFVADLTRRFNELKRIIKKAIVDEDCFGLKDPAPAIVGVWVDLPGRKAFAFPRSADKVKAFMAWLQQQEKAGLLQTAQYAQLGAGSEAAWTNVYIQDSYKRGMIRARYEMGKAGFPVDPLNSTGDIMASMSTPFHADRLGLMYSRTFEELKGITAAMDTQISRILADGIGQGDGPALLARKMLATIDGSGAGTLGITDSLGRFIPAQRRATIMARTEIIRAHHGAMVQEYRNWGVAGVHVKAELVTAEDERVCEECMKYETEGPYTLEEVETLIPIHPQCRCIAIPTLPEAPKTPAELTREDLVIQDIETERLLIKQSFLSDAGDRMMFESFNKQLDVAEWARQKRLPKVVDFTVDINRQKRTGYLNRMDASGGKGFGTETMSRVLQELKNKGITYFEGYIETSNIASQKMMQKVGAIKVRTLKDGAVWAVDFSKQIIPTPTTPARVPPKHWSAVRTMEARRSARVKLTTPKPTPSAEYAARMMKEHEGVIRELCKKEGIDYNKFVVEITKKLEALTKEADVVTRMDHHKIQSLLESGRFKTQFETLTSKGMLDIKARMSLEKAMFNYADNLPVNKRPVYGMVVQNVDETPGIFYGDVVVVMKKSVRNRTTWTAWDTLDSTRRGLDAVMAPSPMTRPNISSLNTVGEKTLSDIRDQVMIKRYNPSRVATWSDYTEAQMHGGVSLRDIDYLIFYKKPDQALIDLMTKQGVKWRMTKQSYEYGVF